MEEDNYIPLSYISQYNYCKRRAGLLMLEQQWSESTDTIKGRAEHENVHTLSLVRKGNIFMISDMQIVSHSLSLIGRCDCIEAAPDDGGSVFPFLDEKRYSLYPIEYKHGKTRDEAEYNLQLCAQAICLEEMFGCRIENGAVFYISSHRRKEVAFDSNMRNMVSLTAKALETMLRTDDLPKSEKTSKCLKCSLKDICIPSVKYSSKKYMEKVYSTFGSDENCD